MPKKITFLTISTILIFIVLSCSHKNPSAPVSPVVSDLRMGLDHNYSDSVSVSVMASDPQGVADIDSVWASYKYLRNEESRIVALHDDGLHGDSAASDGRYSATFADRSGHFELGYYPIRIYARDMANNLSNRLDGVFWTVDGDLPVLCDALGPDTLHKEISEIGYITVVAHDLNGLSDIDSVYTIITKPSGAEGSHIRLYDDGTMGDSIANDGIFSSGIQSGPTNMPGDYIFTFYAVDNENNFSNNPSIVITLY